MDIVALREEELRTTDRSALLPTRIWESARSIFPCEHRLVAAHPDGKPTLPALDHHLEAECPVDLHVPRRCMTSPEALQFRPRPP